MSLPKATRPLLFLLLSATFVLSKTLPRSNDDHDDSYSQGYEDNDADDAAATAAAALLAAAAMGDRIEKAHGVIGCLTFALFFPLGALSLRLLPSRLALPLHITLQLLSVALAITTLGLGLYMAWASPYLATYHAIIGIVAIVGVFFQPITGALHHRFYKQRQSRTGVSYVHIFLGIGFITLGTINGGFGLQLAGAEPKFMIVYGVFAALIWLVWMAVSTMAHMRGHKERKAVAGHVGVKEGSPDVETKPLDDRAEKRENYA